MIKGSCLCGAIVYEAEELSGKVYNCHCSQCRKSHGAAFATQVFVQGATLKFIKGEELLKEYRQFTGQGGIRAFCSNCGSRLMNYLPDKNIYLSVALSSIDSPYDGAPVAHAFVGSKAGWYQPSGDIPSFDTIPDGAIE
jgi:hypothetical protein